MFNRAPSEPNRRPRPAAARAWLRVLACALALLAPSALAPSALALPADRDQPIQIQADWAELDERKGTATYGGDVRMTQGTMLVQAERLVIHTDGDKVVKIVADGKPAAPARYQQQPRADQPVIQASAQHITYVTADQRIELRGAAQLTQKNNQFKGALIEYSIARELVTANGTAAPGGRVSVTFDPNQRR